MKLNGSLGWGCIALFVVVWDLYAPETLSHAVERSLENPVKRELAILSVTLTALHLLDALPDPVDPFHHAGKIRNITRKGLTSLDFVA